MHTHQRTSTHTHTHTQDVIEMANCTEFGLGCSLFTTDYTKAERVRSMA